MKDRPSRWLAINASKLGFGQSLLDEEAGQMHCPMWAMQDIEILKQQASQRGTVLHMIFKYAVEVVWRGLEDDVGAGTQSNA